MPTTLDWNASDPASWANYPVAMATMRGLTMLSPENRVEPGLADRWTREILPDGRERYVFHLRGDIRWSDGVTPLVAEDFVFAWRRALVGNERAEMSDLDGASQVLRLLEAGAAKAQVERALVSVGVRSLDNANLEVILSRPRNYFLSRLANVYLFFPAPSALLRPMSEEARREYYDRPRNGQPLAIGSFRVEQWDRAAERVRLVRNEHCCGASDNRTRSRVVTFMKSEVGAALYERGRLDFVFMDNPIALRGSLPADVHRQPLLSTYFLTINAERPPLNAPEVRRAIAMAIDRSALVSDLFPTCRTTDVLVPEKILPRRGGGTVAFDREGARSAWSRVTPKRKLRLVYRSGESFLPEMAIAERIRSQLMEAGIEVEIDARFDFFDEIARIGPDGLHTTDLYLRRLGADYPHPRTFFTLFERGGNHHTGWDLPRAGDGVDRFEDWMNAGDAEVDLQKANESYWQAESILLKREAIVVPLFHPDRYFRVRPRLAGLGVDAFNFLSIANLRIADATEAKL
jgi:peptide/nickel transport system substrate-binding protein